MKEFMYAFFGIAIGGMITWFVSWHYYVTAGEELAAETERLRSLHKTTLLALQNLQNKNVTFQLSPDEKGDLTRMGVEVRVPGVEASTQAGEETAVSRDPK